MGSLALPQDSSIRTTRSFVRDGELLAADALVLATNEVGDLLVLGLLDGALVVLLALAEEVLLDVVDACKEGRVSDCKTWQSRWALRTLVKVVFLLLSLSTTAGGVVELVADTAEEATVGLLLLRTR
jgi:hypothetical protein